MHILDGDIRLPSPVPYDNIRGWFLLALCPGHPWSIGQTQNMNVIA